MLWVIRSGRRVKRPQGEGQRDAGRGGGLNWRLDRTHQRRIISQDPALGEDLQIPRYLEGTPQMPRYLEGTREIRWYLEGGRRVRGSEAWGMVYRLPMTRREVGWLAIFAGGQSGFLAAGAVAN